MISDTTTSARYIVTNGVLGYSIPFRIYTEADVAVFWSADARTDTKLTLGTHYTVTILTEGGTVNLLPGVVPVGATLAVVSNIPATQEADFSSTSTVNTEALERQLDRQVQMVQQLGDSVARSVVLPATSSETPQDVLDDLFTARDEAEAAASAAATSEAAAAASAIRSAEQALLAEQSRGQACQCADRAEQARDVAIQQTETINVVMATETAKINTIIATNKDDQAAAITASRAWSETDEDVPVDTDAQGNPEYSSKHWAFKSAQLLAGNASTTHKGVMQVGSGLDVAEGVVSAKVATAEQRGIGRAATLADMQKPAEEIIEGPAFLAAGSPALAAIMAALAGKLNIDLSNLDLTKTNAVLQRVSYETGSHMFTTTVIPLDDTIPQNTEGSQILAVDITPKSANSVFVVDVVAHLAASAPTNITVALFKDNEPNAIAAGHTTHSALDYVYTQVLKKTLTIGDNAPHTFKVRFGPDSVGAALNGIYSVRRFGGVYISTITITEYAA